MVLFCSYFACREMYLDVSFSDLLWVQIGICSHSCRIFDNGHMTLVEQKSYSSVFVPQAVA
jgi:hypothetical protein